MRAEHDAALARTLRIAVAAQTGAGSAAAVIDAEIIRLKRGIRPIGDNRMPAFARDLAALCRPLADANAVMALVPMFDFIDRGPGLIDGIADGIIAVFARAVDAQTGKFSRLPPPADPDSAPD